MKTRTPALGAALVALALLLAACGGDPEGRPSVNEISEALQEESEGGEVSDSQADCIAKAFVDSDISDDGLREMVSGDSADVSNIADLDISAADKTAANAALEKAITDCAES
jgi:hypothetical protein